MKKLFPMFILLILLTACQTTTQVTDRVSLDYLDGKVNSIFMDVRQGVKDIINPSFGYTYMLLAIELNSNISSLIIDKTKEKVVGYDSRVITKLTPGSFFYVIPPKIYDGENNRFDEELGRMISNYLTVMKYGVPVGSAADAEYIIVTNIRESLDKSYGVNYSDIALSIVDRFDTPVYLANIRVESKSDRNFWYYATKKAKPVKQLTMKGLGQIMAEGLPEAHGQEDSLIASAKEYIAKHKEQQQ